MLDAYLLGGVRTPIGKLLGKLAHVPAPSLAATAIRESVARSGLGVEAFEEVILGNVLSAGLGQAPARQAALEAGLPPSIAAMSVNKVCGSGLKAVMLAGQAIRAGDARAIIAGGMESMSRAPHMVAGARQGWKFGDQQLVDSMIRDGLWCSAGQVHMGVYAEQLAAEHRISREDQDAFAAESHRRAVAAIAAGRFQGQIAAVKPPEAEGAAAIDRDEGPRPGTTVAKLAALKAAFQSGGTVTAGNASQISDGAAAVAVVHSDLARASGARPRARIVAAATAGVLPKDLFVAPVAAVRRVLSQADLQLSDVDLVELNEAFAAQCLACQRLLGLDPDRLNVDGGAIALGHPIGASGARVLVTLLHALEHRQLRRGLAALCLGGGNAVAMVIERE